MSHDKAASLPKATDFLPSPSEAPSAPARPTLYSIAVSLSGPPPPPHPPSSSHPLHFSYKGPTPAPSILDPQHFPSLAGGREAGKVSGVEGDRNACKVRGESGPQHETQDSKSHSPKPEEAQDDASGSGRIGPIQVEWLDFDNAQGSDDMARQASSSSSTPHPSNLTPTSPSVPSTGLLSLPAGSIHLYRHGPTGSANPKSDVPSSLSIFTTAEVKMDSSSPAGNSFPSLLAVLAVPSYMSPSDFLAYVSPREPDIECLRLIRDVSPSRSIVLVQMRTSELSREFLEDFNGKAFNAFEPERCHVVPILHVLTHFTQPSPFSPSPSPSQPLESRPFPVALSSDRSSNIEEEALKEAVELPTCPVCLERMDSSVTGLVTVPCLHTYHCACLRKWGNEDSRCPVCRYSSKPLHLPAPPSSNLAPQGTPTSSASAPSSCASCSTTEALWICLICGVVGCGRYSEGKHAQGHWETTGHMFALELDSQRVWDYSNDSWIHRLIVDKSSGSVVELPSASSSSKYPPPPPTSSSTGSSSDVPSEKLEAISLEYAHLLSSQLDTQRHFYAAHQETLEFRIGQLESLVSQGERERDRMRIGRLERELREEREMNRGLMINLSEMRKRVDGGREEVEGLKRVVGEKEEEVRDLMFFLEARDKIAAAEGGDKGADDGQIEGGTSVLGELQGGSVSLPPATTTTTTQQDGSTPKKKKKGKKK